MDNALNSAVAMAMREGAQHAILPRFRPGRPVSAHWKAAGEAVTIADRESELILAERLARLVPGAHIVGEEAAHHDPGILAHMAQGTCWIIDPLDGTANFAAGTGPFGILVALVQDGLPIGGWILDPLTDRFCAAQAGHGATINDEPFRVRASGRTRPQVAVTRLFAEPETRSALVAALSSWCEVLDSPRCAADQYPRIAQGGNDATVFTRTIAWDHAAGVIFLNEAGGRAARPDGRPYHCKDAQGGLVAATCSRDWDAITQALDEADIELASIAIPT